MISEIKPSRQIKTVWQNDNHGCRSVQALMQPLVLQHHYTVNWVILANNRICITIQLSDTVTEAQLTLAIIKLTGHY